MQRIKVVFFNRKPRPFGTFSLENIFRFVQANLPSDIETEARTAAFDSNGIFRRLFSAAWAALHQGDVNHVTGDTHFLTLLMKRRKTILTIHDIGVMDSGGKLARLFYKIFFLQIPIARAGYVTTVSEATKQEVLKYVSCDPGKIRVIYNPAFKAFRRVDKTFNREKPVILHVGMAHNKNFDRLVEALEGIPCHLSVVGKLEETHEEKLKKYGVEYSFVYNISNEEMVAQYENCDLLAFASTLEGFGMPIVEANAIGRPVLTSNISSMPEVAGDAACFVDPYSVESIRAGLLKIIGDDDFRNQLIANGFKNSQRFTPEKIVKDYYELYQEVFKCQHKQIN